DGSLGFVVEVRIGKEDYASLHELKFDDADWEWQLAVRSYRSGGIYDPVEQSDIVVGPVASSKKQGGFYVKTDKLDDQYAFRTYAALRRLQYVGVIPSTSG